MMPRQHEPKLYINSFVKSDTIKLIVPALIAITLFFILLYAVFLPGFEKNVFQRKREGVREMVYAGWSILDHYHTLAQNGALTSEQAQSQAADEIRSLRYGLDMKDYFWISTLDSIMIVHPYRTDIEGMFLMNIQEKRIRDILVGFVKIADNQGEGFSEYLWQWKDDPTRLESKVSYVKLFKPWGWIIGSGLYIDDVRHDVSIMERRIKRLSFSIFSLVFIFIFIIVFQNIKANKERVRNVEALLRSEERFRETVDLLPEIIFETDVRGMLTFTNQHAYEISGFTREDQISGFHALDLIDPVDRQRAGENVRAILSGNILGGEEYLARRKDGSHFPVLIRTVPIIQDGKVTGLRGIIVDITERKRAENALRENEEKYRQLFDMESDAIFLIDNATGQILEVNKAACDQYGYNRDELCLMKNVDLSAEPEKTKMATLIKDERIPVRWHRKKDGTIFPVEIGASHFNLQGQDVHIAAIRDITDRLEAREQLEKQQLFLRNVIDNAPNSIYVMDSDHRIVLTNKIFAEMYGLSEDDIIGKNPADLMPDTTYAELFKDDERAIFSGELPRISREHIVLDRTGSKRWLYTNKVPLKGPSGTVDYLLGISSDITVLMETEAALRKSEERLSTIFNMAKDAIFIKDRALVYTDINPAMAQLFRQPVEAIIGKSDFDLFSEEEAKAIRVIDNRILNGEIIEEEHVLKINNIPRTFNVIKVPMRDNVGKIIAIIGIARDLTERKRLESQFIQAQKMESIGRLAGGIAHDFNNILTVIIGSAEYALLSLKQDTSLYDDLIEIKNNADRAANLTRQLLAFSRQQIIEPRIIDLNTIVYDMDKMLRRIIGEQIELELKLREGLWNVNMDPGQVQQILTNLIVNSRDAFTSGIGKIVIETDNIILDEQYIKVHGGASSGEYAMLAVSDNGVGMDEETKSHIFEPFYTTKELGKGTGLGLATCYGIVKQNNGSIWVYSESGIGTTVKIYLPRSKSNGTRDDVVLTRIEMTGGNETLLLVEDEAPLKNLATKILKSKGYTVFNAQNGEDALELFDKAAIQGLHLLITDVVMPKMGGIELAQRVKKLYPDVKVLYMSGYTDSTIVAQGILDHNVEFLQKPFTPTSFLQKIRTVLDKA